MHKKITILMGSLLALLSFPLYAQEEELPDASIDVDLNFVSSYIFRGADLFENRAVQKGESYGSHTGEVAFQPSITFNTPVEGLYFNLWGSFATAGRSDQDVDGALQTRPGGDAIDINTAIFTATADNNAIDALALANGTVDDGSADGLPGFYRENNGLDRLDELDLTIGYGADTRVGSFGFGIVSYTNPNSKTLGGFGNPFEEIFFSYALPFLPDLGFSAYTDIGGNGAYYNLSYGSGVELADGISLDFGAGVGYGVVSKLQGIQDVTGSVGVSLYGFSVSYNLVYRPNLAFFDDDRGTNSFEGVFWPTGGSSAGDGLVVDPGQTTDFFDRSVNAAISSAISDALGTSYTYTPRQKLPKTLWFISAGYSFSI